MRMQNAARRFGAAVGVVALVTLLVACEDPPTTVRQTTNHDCQIDSHSIAGTSKGTAESTYDTTGPQAVNPASALTLTVVPAPFSVDGNPGGNGTLTQVSNLVSKVTVPANASLTSFTIGGWSNVGTVTPSASSAGNVVTVVVPGPIRAGTNANPNVATLPTLTLNLKATGAVGSRINPIMAGSSYSTPGLTFDATVTGTPIGTLKPSFACFPSPARVMHSTLISGDATAPVITVSSPVDGASVRQNSSLRAAFTCDDGGGSGVASCVGSASNGATLDTSTVGAHTLTVTATDKQGLVATRTATYTVSA